MILRVSIDNFDRLNCGFAHLLQTNLFVAALPGLLPPMPEFLRGNFAKKKRRKANAV
jgi:hypothetical protein